MGLIKVGSSVIKGDAFSNEYETVLTSSTAVINTNFDLDANSIVVYIDGVRQQASAYSVSGARQITLSETVVSGTNVAVVAMDPDYLFDLSSKADLASPHFTGNVGIGTDTPSSALDVNGQVIIRNSGLAYDLYNYGSSFTKEDTFFGNGVSILTSSGNVGVGTVNPTSKLYVTGASDPNSLCTIGAGGGISTDKVFRVLRDTSPVDESFVVYRNSNAYFSANVGIGISGPYEKLHVNGTIICGAGSATNGDTVLVGNYSGANNYLLTLGSEYSSGGSVFGFAVKPATGSAGYQSSTSINIPRCAIKLDSNINFMTAPMQQVAYGSAVTMTNRMYLSNAGIFTVVNLAGSGNRAVYSDPSGALTNTASDLTLKTNIEPINYGLAEVLEMNPIMFQWKDTEKMGAQKEVGFIAQEMEEIIPEVIGTNSDGLKSLDYPKLTAVLCNAIKELSNKNNALEARLAVLEAKLA